MTVVDTETGEIVPDLSEDEYLEALSSRVRDEYRNLRLARNDAVEAFFAIGQCLNEARSALPSNEAYGAWFHAQQFGFTTQWGLTLRTGALNEALVRPALESQLSNGATSVNFEKAVKEATASSSKPTPKNPKPNYKNLAEDLAQVLRDLNGRVEDEEWAAIEDALNAYERAVAA